MREGLQRADAARSHFEAAARRHPGGEAGGVLQAVLAHVTVLQEEVARVGSLLRAPCAKPTTASDLTPERQSGRRQSDCWLHAQG